MIKGGDTQVTRHTSAYQGIRYISGLLFQSWGNIYVIDMSQEIFLGTSSSENSFLETRHQSDSYDYTRFNVFTSRATPNERLSSQHRPNGKNGKRRRAYFKRGSISGVNNGVYFNARAIQQLWGSWK